MTAPAAEPLTERFPTSFEEFRDAWEAEDAGKGLAGLLQRMILRLLTALVAMLAEARAGAREAAAEGMEGTASPASGGDVVPAAEDCVAEMECKASPRVAPEDLDADAKLTSEEKSSCGDSTRACGDKLTVAPCGTRDALTGAEDARAAVGGADRDAEQTHHAGITPHPPASRAPPSPSRGEGFAHRIANASFFKNRARRRGCYCAHVVTLS